MFMVNGDATISHAVNVACSISSWRDLDGDGDMDFIGTRGNSYPYDGVFWLEQIRSTGPRAAFERACEVESEEIQLP